MAFKGEFHAPDIDKEFFPVDQWFTGFAADAFVMDRLMFVRILMAVVLMAFFMFAMRNPRLIPSGVQNFAEICLDFVRVHVAEEILGKEQGRRFLPVIATIFFAVLAMNLPTVLPGLNISPNARIGFPIVLAALGYITFIYAGAKKYGFLRYIKASVVIPNVPPALHILLIPIEILSTFILRPVTLTIRLMANMLAGHLIIVLLFSATNFFFWQLNGWTLLSAGISVLSVAFTLFELLVIFLQAYIFALLVAVYIDSSLHADNH
ncbi:F0F1 ATP synthase subunit A [Dietzia aurantiaca]|uniref:F0F1 ATP synthase subunit A n=1 Tax=Dietzia aurantiaca TaxID=983873 RepID=UPI001E611396|nr:F0F1 ATP synthase subunit A [Dietzia aurantiaca]MCD2263287.1 F0F1 ATP synthase subunit A [Dietzia aurantiaca]